MKSVSQSMSPQEAAQAFYGQDDAAFSEMVSKLASQDPRLLKVFQTVKRRFNDPKN
ncbi:hypothetical protein [Loktanella sp. Alg231-35]|uniref:hypothetical protein n=1 Tax=Loktanella sp. Alg231-35 TaxID=1922220 RepID=UPI00131EDBDC|nr:hypothetical protein [Loktanella sp. Alg231-35]